MKLFLFVLAKEMVLPPKIFLTSVIISFCLFSSHNSKLLSNGNDTDRLSLLAFKARITSDPFGALSSWNQSIHFCEWHGITCSRLHRQRVTVLNLSSSRLAGGLSPHIGNLSFLKILDLRNNSFMLTIPQELGFLNRLQKLQLTNNSFSGKIPINISRCSNLQVLDLGGNNLRGKLPSELALLSKLEAFLFYKNNLTDEIPSSLGNLSSLHTISGTLNSLSGVIPDSFGQLKKLTFLAFGGNYLNGAIPSSLYNLSSLTVFSVPVNQLEGNLPPDLGLWIPNIEIFRVATNRLSGIIPPTISNASKLLEFEFTSNNFSGKVPSLVGLKNLVLATFDKNNLGTGKDDDLNFLSYLVNCSNLEAIVISDNNFGGILPQYITNFSKSLRKIGFGRNQIRGSIPSGIGNLVGLDALGLETNHLTGPIPSSLGKLPALGALFLNINELAGTIPSSLGNLTSLQGVNLRLNNLQGNIPASLGNWRSLSYMYLSQNKFTGTIPKEIMSISSLSTDLYLSDNFLTGSIPLEIGKLVNLGTLDLSNNRLSGEMPGTLGSCISLETLHLEGNSLQGPIPESWSSLRAIQTLDLSRNNLSGEIPEFLGSFRLLLNLNLSFNDFRGEVPTEGAFKNGSTASLLGNEKLCGGLTQLKLPRCVSSEPKREKSLAKLRTIIAIFSGLLFLGLISVLSFIAFYRSRKARNRAFSASSPGASYLKITYRDLFKATDGFSSNNLLGMGSFGSVYKGIFHQGETETAVAVKVLNLQQKGALKSFMAECETLRNIRHRNLIKILTICSSIDFSGNDFKALIYEFMVNRSLEELLHPSEEQTRYLVLTRRLSIAIDVASALDYLHNSCQPPIVHCDLKPSNVLLDDDMTACIGDFGLARFIPEEFHGLSSSQASSTILKGSIGYAAPEYAMGSKASTHSDVYSYGILLLEMFTGKRPTDELFKDEMNLHKFVAMSLQDQVTKILDPMLLTQYQETNKNSGFNNGFMNPNIMECIVSVLRMGVCCSAELPKERMNINSVATELHHIRENLLQSLSDNKEHDSAVQFMGPSDPSLAWSIGGLRGKANDYDGVEFWSNPERTGWLTKQGEYIKTWRRRWFVLKQGKLFWFKDTNVTRVSRPRGVIPVATCLTVKGAEDILNKQNAFELSTRNETMYFITDSEKEKEDWINSIGRSIVQHSRSVTDSEIVDYDSKR